MKKYTIGSEISKRRFSLTLSNVIHAVECPTERLGRVTTFESWNFLMLQKQSFS